MKKFLIYLASFLFLFGVSVAFAGNYIEDFEDEIFDPKWFAAGDYVITADKKLHMYGNVSEFGFSSNDEFINRFEADIYVLPTRDQNVGMEVVWIPENGEPPIDFSIYLYTSGYFSPGPEFVAHKEQDPLPSHSLGAGETNRWYNISITLYEDYAQFEIDGIKYDLFHRSFQKPDDILQNVGMVHAWPPDPADVVDYYTDNIKVYTSTEKCSFVDVLPGSNHEESICAIYGAEITTGCSQNPLRFCPQDPVTRAQMAAFIVRAKEGEPPTDYCAAGSPFPDVDSNLNVCKYIKRLSELGITTGYGDGTYRPYNNVNRAQMAAFIVRAKEGEPPTDYCSTGSPFPDVSVNSPTCKYIKRFFELGITTGYPDGTYRPSNTVIRRQMAAFLDRAFLQMD